MCLNHTGGTHYIEIVLPTQEVEADLDEESEIIHQFIFTSQREADHVHDHSQGGTVTSNRENGELPEGNYKVILREIRKLEQSGRYFINLKMEVREGAYVGRQIEDRVIAWPINARTQHLATALGLDAESLGTGIDGCVGREFWNRRRETIKSDGTSQ